MNIGEASVLSGVSAKMIRYYESTGLIHPATRSGSGAYRVYSPADIHTLKFVRRARDLGFSVTEIGALLRLWEDHARASADVKTIALEKVRELDLKIGELQAMRSTLMHLATTCHGNHRPDCPILNDLSESHRPKVEDIAHTPRPIQEGRKRA